MGFFNIFKRKQPVSDETRLKFPNELLNKYFDGSKEKWFPDAEELRGITKFNLSTEEMATLLLRCIGIRHL